MRDKAVDEIAGLLFPAVDFVILTEPRQPRAISAPLLAEMTSHLAKKSDVVRDPGEALERADRNGHAGRRGLCHRLALSRGGPPNVLAPA